MTDSKNKPALKQGRFLRGFLKILLWIIGIPFTVILVLIIALQFSTVQLYVTDKTTAYLSKRIKSKVTLQKINIAFPKMIALEDLYIEDQKHDTLLYTHSLQIDLDLWELLSKKIDITSIELEKATGHISRAAADFNFDYIVEAFASPEKGKVEIDTTASPWRISLKAIGLKDVFFTYHDKVSGISTDIKLGEFKTELDEFDLEKKKIHIRSIVLDKTFTSLNIDPVIKKETSSDEPFDFDLGVSEIRLEEIKFIFKDNGNKQNLDINLSKLSLDVKSIDFENLKFDLDKLVLSGSRAIYSVDQDNTKDPGKINTKESPTGLNWLVTLKKLELENNSFTYHDNTERPLKKGIDYNHLITNSINVDAKNIYISDKKIRVDINQANLEEQSGLSLKELTTGFSYDSAHIELSALKLETGNSKINGALGIKYDSLNSLKDSIGNSRLNLEFEKTSLAVSDILYFAPELFNDTIFNGKQHTSIRLNGSVDGTVDDLRFKNFELKTLENTSIALKGSVKNIRDPKNMFISLQSFHIIGSEKDVLTVFSENVIPKQIKIPASFDLKGSFSGYLKNFNAELNANTSIGNIEARAKMNPGAGNTEQPYDIKISSGKFDLGKLLNQTDLLGPATVSAVIVGSGFDFNNLNADLNIHVINAEFKKYVYKDLYIVGKLKDKGFTGKININDDNLAFDYEGALSFDPTKPNYVFTLDLKGADLRALNLSTEEFRVSALVQSDIHDRSDKNFTGTAGIRNALIIRNGKKYPFDSLVFISEFKEGVSKITLRSEIMTADFNGDITLDELAAALKKHVNTYFNMQVLADERTLNPQKFDFEFKIIDPSLLTKNLLPELKNLEPFSIKGGFDSQAKKLDVKANVPQIVYAGVKVDSLKLNINSDAEKLTYQFSVVEASNPTFKFENLNLNGELKNNSLTFQLQTNKDDSTKTIVLGGIVNEKNKIYSLKLNQELVFNAEKWNVDPSNYLEFGRQGLRANNLVISKGSSALGLNSKGTGAEPPLEIKFTNFDLAVISKLMENNNDLASGNVNGNIVIEKHNQASGFRSDLVINNFIFKSVPIGTIKLKADNIENSLKYDVDLGIEGNGNDISANGSFLANAKDNNLDFILTVKNLNLATIEPFTFGQVTRMSGSLNGKLNLKGSTSKPDITGDLNLKESAFRPRIIDSYLTIHEGKMTFASKKIILNNLAIYDSLNNKATLNGFVGIADLQNVNFDAQLKTDNFLALNTKRKDNPLYFGRVFLDSDIKIKGTADSPQIDVKAKLNKGSTITYVKPETELGKNESKGIVEFADTLYRPGIMTRTNDTLKGTSEIKGIILNASLTFDKAVELKMLVDQDSGDSLYIMGSGSLDFTLDRSGRTTLTGKYRINEGGYHLAISDVVKRNFKIEKGSSVTWSGDILEPYVDLKAIYVIKTSPVDLVQDELSGMNELERNKYRNLLTFYVYLKMTGFISSPDISFDIQLAPADRGAMSGAIENKLAQLRGDETELNKQVFALLTLRRFIGVNPLDNGNEGGISSASRSSASQVLTQQLSTLSDKYVNFVDLDLGVNSFEDYSSGSEEGRTQLQVGVSKQLLKDKVTVRVGGNVELEGERANQNNANDVAGNISIDYKLTEDGRFKLKAFRENQYENPIEGELTKTGAGVIYVRNFKRFKELLKKPVKRKQAEIKDPKDDDN